MLIRTGQIIGHRKRSRSRLGARIVSQSGGDELIVILNKNRQPARRLKSGANDGKVRFHGLNQST
jgi:hypothetical protein